MKKWIILVLALSLLGLAPQAASANGDITISGGIQVLMIPGYFNLYSINGSLAYEVSDRLTVEAGISPGGLSVGAMFYPRENIGVGIQESFSSGLSSTIIGIQGRYKQDGLSIYGGGGVLLFAGYVAGFTAFSAKIEISNGAGLYGGFQYYFAGITIISVGACIEL